MGKRKGLSPVQRTLKRLKERGRLCQVVERFNPHAGPFGVRQDLFGFIDLIALSAPLFTPSGVLVRSGIIGIQCCGIGAHSGHLKKILGECREKALTWLKSMGRIELWSWNRRKIKTTKGKKVVRWHPRVEEITMEHFNGRRGLSTD